MILLGPERQHEEQRRGFGVRQESLEELQGRRVRPVQVLEGGDDRPLLGEPREERADHLERAVLGCLGRQLGEPRPSVGLEGQPEHRTEVRVVLDRAIPEQPADLPAKGDPDAELGVVGEDAEPRSQQVAERPVRHGLAVRHAPALEPDRAPAGGVHRLEAGSKLGQQAALPDPGLAGHDEDAARAGGHVLQLLGAVRQLGPALDQLRLDALEPTGDHRGAPRPDHGERGHRFGLPLEVERLRIAPPEERLDQTLRRIADEHRPRRGRPLQPRGDVDRVAEGRVLHPAATADLPDDHQAGMDPDADAEPGDVPSALDLAGVLVDLVPNADRGADGTLRVVLVRGRRAEQREHPVTGEILDRAAERLDRGDDPRDGLADDQLQLLGIEPFGERRGSDQVREHRRHHTALVAGRPVGAAHGEHPPTVGRSSGDERCQRAGLGVDRLAVGEAIEPGGRDRAAAVAGAQQGARHGRVRVGVTTESHDAARPSSNPSPSPRPAARSRP
jgi:hypothetical protein